jgi:hypothetical protein
MKTYLKLAMLAMVLIAPAGVYAADSVGDPIGNYQEAQKEPQRILDPVEFFNKTTGKVKVWYWRAESGYEFYDAPGFHPRTGGALTAVTLDVITEWQQSQKNATRCYIIQRDPRAPVIYRDHLPGMDPETGRECRLVTISLVERLNQYANGKKPGKIKSTSEFFDPRTSEPIVWYADHGGTIEIFDLLGYDPETGDELLAVTPEIVDRWKAQVARKPPHRVHPNSHPFFDPKTGRPNIWHSPGENGEVEFFDGPGFHPRTGKALTEITQDFAERLRDDKAWADAEKTGTVAAYLAYLQNFGSGTHVSEASQRIVALNEAARKAADEKAWADAETAGTAAAYTSYIQNFGGGAHVADAHQRVTELSRKEADDKAWADAVRAGTAAAITAYTQNFSSGAHVAEARQRLAALDEQARKEADEKAWADAETAGTAAAFNGYIQKFGSGAHVAEARQRLAALDEERERQKRRCDELAANPNDQNRRRTSRGVSYDQLKTQIPAAIHACELAVQLNPADLTLQYQRARAVELADPVRGQAMQDRLVKLGYPAAFDNAGSLLLNDPKCRQHCINEAVKLFRKGAALGDPDAMMSLADQIRNGQATGNVIELYQRAAKLGHPGAIRALEALAQERTPPRLIFRFPF